jgi:hypothetical protein
MKMSEQKNRKKIVILALVSVVSAVLFSFLGAPFLRAFSVSTRSRVFWSVGVVFVATLFVLGHGNNKIYQTAVYVGAIWMTLGSYNELEKRGINWRQATSVSLLSGILFAALGYFLVSKTQLNSKILSQIVDPLLQTVNSAFPENKIEASVLISFLPGIFIASLCGALAFGFSLEARVVRMFQIQKYKVASALRWIEFRLPDVFIWVSLFALLFSVVSFDQKILQTTSINILIISAVAYLFQGLTVVEFMMRFLKMGSVLRTITYLLIFFQLAPVVIFIGLIDYWADFRKLVRKKAKTN